MGYIYQCWKREACFPLLTTNNTLTVGFCLQPGRRPLDKHKTNGVATLRDQQSNPPNVKIFRLELERTLTVGQCTAGRRSWVGRGAILAAFSCRSWRRAFFLAGC